MKKSCLSFVVACSVVGSEGFVVKRYLPIAKTTSFLNEYNDPVGGTDLYFNPYEGYQAVDVDRAKECAENFGECSTDEMEHLRANLHKERLQNFVFGGTPEAVEHYVLEEELDLQLALLNKENEKTTETSLFPTEMVDTLPHINDARWDEANMNDGKDKDLHMLQAPTPVQVHAIEESILEENTLEAVMFCAVLAAFMFLPQLTESL